jgi:hypothetical protein
LFVALFLFLLFTGTSGNDQKIEIMTGQLEPPESWNDRKAEMTGKLEWPESRNYQKRRNDRIDPYANILPEWLFISWTGNAVRIIEILRIFYGLALDHLFVKNTLCANILAQL